MLQTQPTTVKRLPEPDDRVSRKLFLREIKRFVSDSHAPRLIVDLSRVEQISAESIDLLLECVGHLERGDGEVCVAGASPQTTVILEITQATSVLKMFASVTEATSGREPRDSELSKPDYQEDRAA